MKKIVVYNVFVLLFLASLALRGFVDRHVLVTHGPSINPESLRGLNCEREAEALFIALGAMPYLYAGADQGLSEAVRAVRTGDCGSRFEERYISPALSLAIHRKWAALYPTMKAQAPNLFLSRKLERRRGIVYQPRWPIGTLTILVQNYDDLSSGQGLIHYLRCDYSLFAEPSHTFLLAMAHSGFYDLTHKQRLEECGSIAIFEALIDAKLTEIISASEPGYDKR